MPFPPITIYTTKTCKYCRATKDLFAKHEVPYTEIDVGADQAKAREMIRISGQMGVPVILIEKDGKQEMVIGYDQQRLQELLHI